MAKPAPKRTPKRPPVPHVRERSTSVPAEKYIPYTGRGPVRRITIKR